MIKLPIVLTEHKDGQAAVRDAVLTDKKTGHGSMSMNGNGMCARKKIFFADKQQR